MAGTTTNLDISSYERYGPASVGASFGILHRSIGHWFDVDRLCTYLYRAHLRVVRKSLYYHPPHHCLRHREQILRHWQGIEASRAIGLSGRTYTSNRTVRFGTTIRLSHLRSSLSLTKSINSLFVFHPSGTVSLRPSYTIYKPHTKTHLSSGAHREGGFWCDLENPLPLRNDRSFEPTFVPRVRQENNAPGRSEALGASGTTRTGD